MLNLGTVQYCSCLRFGCFLVFVESSGKFKHLRSHTGKSSQNFQHWNFSKKDYGISKEKNMNIIELNYYCNYRIN